ncbi:MAG TPA: hypothetical protein VMH22_06475 [bacterium]|nr:hypothetical protein [bacterium]
MLSIPFKTALRPLGKTGASYTILSADGSLYIGAAAVEGHCDLRVTNVRAHDYETEFSAHFPLDRLELEQIEKVRAGGDVKARCDLRFTVALSHDLDIGKPEGPQPFVTSYESAFVQLEFTIPHSTWTNRVLAGFGHGRIQLLEVPVPAKHAPEVFAGAVAELAQARAYYLDADYEKVMSHCRKSLESILIVLKPDLSGLDKPGFGQKLARTLEQHLSQQLSESKRASMHGTATAIWNLTSISTHHLGGPEYFDRADAEATMLHCSALLAHVGHAIRRKEDSEK